MGNDRTPTGGGTAQGDRGIAKKAGAFRVLGIDPGSNVTGYGIVEEDGRGLCCIKYGEIKPARGASLSSCLQTICGGIQEVILGTGPEALAIENIFY